MAAQRKSAHSSGAKRRGFVRHPSEIPIDLAPAESSCPSRLNDVSVGGLSCRSARAMEPGAIATVRIPTVRPPFEAVAQVVWCRPSEGGEFDLGMEFLAEDDAFRARMVEQVCHIERYRKDVLDREGRSLEPEEATAEWIDKFAATFP